jgi:protein required for attachment to host cells
MKAHLVVVDAARARLFSWKSSDDVALDGYPRLVELEDLANPEGRLQDREVYSNELSRATNRVGGDGPAHAFDDHRDAHRGETQRRFIRDIARRLNDHVTRDKPSRVILVSETQVLHDLRQEVESSLPRDVQVAELAENLSKETPTHLQQILSKKGLLPAQPKGPTADQFVPRGQPNPGSDVKR